MSEASVVAVVGEASAFERDWQDWQRRRYDTVSSPWGTAALASTAWLTGDATAVDGLPGRWRLDGVVVVGSGIGTEHEEIRIAPGEEHRHGNLLLRHFARHGSVALRILDPSSTTRTTLTGIDAYEPSIRWVVRGRFRAAEPEAELAVTAVDGVESSSPLGGRIELEIDGAPVTLTVTRGRTGFSAVFGDATNGTETYRFRFLDVGEPEPDGMITIDFNRAYLPPCAFSDQYVCPLPSTGNRWIVAVRAG